MFLCCGWEYGSVIMPFLPHLLAQFVKSAEICVTGGVHTNDDMAQWPRLKTHMELLPCQLKHIQCD